MDRWNMTPVVLEGSTLPASAFLYRDWSIVNELTDVSMFSWDLELGARWRLPTGYGIELAWTRTSYHDKDPILEDETGRYNALSMMVSKSF